jgi:protoporphyrinogen oxidase
MKKHKCVIIGAGLSGLACAITLKRQGFDPILVEKNFFVGGRVQTRRSSGGFLLDEGFQVLLDSYPELTNFVDLKALNLRQFNSGALIFTGKKMELLANPIRHPETLLSGLIRNLVSAKDKALIMKLIATSQLVRNDSEIGTVPTEQFLIEFGFSSDFIESFWRPFLTGVFLDPQLQIGSHYFRFLIRCFSLGQVSLPQLGMAELPKQMSQQLNPQSIRLGVGVRKWSEKHIELESGEVFEADRVICAFDPGGDSPAHSSTPYQSVTTHYFSGRELSEMSWQRWLVLIPEKFKYQINHMALVTSVSQAYGPEPLLSVSLVGKKTASVSEIAEEIQELAGRTLSLQFVATTQVDRALPRVEPSPTGFHLIDQVYYCGDRWASPSINGALRSGRLTAEAIIKEFCN